MSRPFFPAVGTLLMEYINEGGDTAFLSTPSPEMESQAKAEAKCGDSISTDAAENSLPAALTALDDLGIDTAAASSAYFDYLTANSETKGGALTNAITAINTTIDTAIAQQQAAGANTSALTALKAQLENSLSAAGQGQTSTNTAPDAAPDVGDLFVQYADTIGVDAMPSFSEFERMYNKGGEAWNELTQQVEYKEALRSGEITPFTSLDEYKAMVDGQGESGYNGIEESQDNNIFRGDDLLYSDKGQNGLSKSHINNKGDLVPANINGIYKGKKVSVMEHILGGYRRGAKSNSPYTSFTDNKGIVATYGENVIRIDIDRLREDINAGKVKGVEILTPKQVQAAISDDTQTSSYWRELALKWVQRDNEYLIRGMIPNRYIIIINGGN